MPMLVGLFTATAQVVIEVTDANDNAPRFSQPSYAVSVPEMISVGSSVVALQASDQDSGANARLTYTVLNQYDHKYFYADSIYAVGTGVIRIKQVTLSKQESSGLFLVYIV